MLPARISRKSDKADRGKRSPAHRKWIRGHACTACGSETAIECAHVRIGTDGGMGIKPSDSIQHRVGEESFEMLVGIDMKKTAAAFYKASPHRGKLDA